MADLTALAQEIDGLLTEPALVYGSLPADASDLDLLVRASGVADLARLLPAAGFDRRGADWVRWSPAVCVVDATPVETWQLPAAELTSLYDDAQPLPGLLQLREPAPHHQLLVLARRLVRTPGVPADKHLARVHRAVAAAPAAFAEAGRRAAAWGCEAELGVLQAVHATGRAVTAREAQAARLAEQRRAGRGRLAGMARAGRSWLPRRGRGAVVALSGLDGSGKSTQAGLLCEALTALGYEPVTAWERVTYNPALDRITAPLRRVLMLLRRLRPTTTPAATPEPVTGAAPVAEPSLAPDRQAARALRESSPLLAGAWVTLVTLLHAWSLRRATLREVRRGRVVIRDRYVLDSVVQLQEQYGDQVDLRLQSWLVRRLPPRPAAAYFLDVPAEEAYRRKQDEHTPEQLASHRQRYLAAADSLGVRTIDGSRSVAEISEQLARDVAHHLEP